ncbi:hypothetical protein [Aquipseudomonas alcaligenes]|uniref:ABC transmembrane type-1 domain-containing protein n=1 Tax=Aquipseudomonas alcaligenes TaxID=43263 RepID=A0A1N6RNK3_AQUAC|nr:hypothetical protein [Pseudomonas alcaligenes]SIQ30367.1 hypothetical protein SAMN05878282_10389 [Pseudomonas alcaligenes]
MQTDDRLRWVLSLTIRLSYSVPALLAPGLCAQLLGWPMGRFSLWGFFEVILTNPGYWYQPALLIAVTLIIFAGLSTLWTIAIRLLTLAFANFAERPKAAL